MTSRKWKCGGPNDCLICYSNGRKRSNIRGHYGYSVPRKERWYVPLSNKHRREVSSDNAAGTPAAETDPAFAKQWPTLHAFLTETVWEDGTPRETAKVSIWCEGGYWKGAINDQDAEQSAYTSKSSFKAVLDSLEKGLLGDSLDWRKWGNTTKRKKST